MKTEHPLRITELDALRGIAALMVVFFHYSMGQPAAAWGLKTGVTGVDLFFIISGFVILLTIEKTRHWKDFVVSRFSRIYPTYWTCVTITALLLLFNESMRLKWLLVRYAFNMTMFQSYFGMTDIDGPYWTMIIEMLFYLFMLLVFISGQLKRVEIIGTLFLIPVYYYAVYMQNAFPGVFITLGNRLPLINHFPLFLAGILFYKIRFDKPTIIRYAVIAVCFYVQLSLFWHGGKSRGFINHTEYILMLGIFFGFFILYVNGLLGFIVNKVTLFLGKISFGLYLIHQYLALMILIPFLTAHTPLNHFCAAFLVTLPVELGLAYLIHISVEKPAMEGIRRWYKKRQVAGAGRGQ